MGNCIATPYTIHEAVQTEGRRDILNFFIAYFIHGMIQCNTMHGNLALCLLFVYTIRKDHDIVHDYTVDFGLIVAVFPTSLRKRMVRRW